MQNLRNSGIAIIGTAVKDSFKLVGGTDRYSNEGAFNSGNNQPISKSFCDKDCP